MRRELPNRPHLDHLKAQAKELLDGHRRRDPAALERLRSALPAYVNASEEGIAGSKVALHDAQSAIAREYGFPSWAALRTYVLSVQASPDPAKFVESLFGHELPEPIREALRDARSKTHVEELSAIATPEMLPLLSARNALLSPGAIAPLMIGRPASIAALSRATEREAPLIAVFAQRDEGTESPRFEDLHSVGCLALVRRFFPAEGGTAWVVLEGVRWIRLAEIVSVEPHSGGTAPAREDMPVLAEQIAIRHRDRNPRNKSARPARAAQLPGVDARPAEQSREFSQVSAVLRPASRDLKCDLIVCEVVPRAP